MKELKIIVSGQAGTGKSTVAYLLADFLSHTGFNVNINMDEGLDLEKFEEKFPDRLNTLLKQDIKIDVYEELTKNKC